MKEIINAETDYLEELKEEDVSIKDFRKLRAYKLSLGLTKRSIGITQRMPSYETYSLADQLRRSSMGVCAQLAEGNGQLYKKREMQFISIATGSLCETQCWLDICLINNYITEEEHKELDAIAVEIKKLLVVYVRSLLSNN